MASSTSSTRITGTIMARATLTVGGADEALHAYIVAKRNASSKTGLLLGVRLGPVELTPFLCSHQRRKTARQLPFIPWKNISEVSERAVSFFLFVLSGLGFGIRYFAG